LIIEDVGQICTETLEAEVIVSTIGVITCAVSLTVIGCVACLVLRAWQHGEAEADMHGISTVGVYHDPTSLPCLQATTTTS